MGAMLVSAWGGPQPMKPDPNSDSPGNTRIDSLSSLISRLKINKIILLSSLLLPVLSPVWLSWFHNWLMSMLIWLHIPVALWFQAQAENQEYTG